MTRTDTPTPHFVPGLVPDPYDPRDHVLEVSEVAAKRSPPTYDLTRKFPPLPEQGRLGCCGPHSGTTALQYAEQQKGRGLGSERMSRLALYVQTRIQMGTINVDSGVNLRTMLKVMADQGAPPEHLWPYEISKFRTVPPANVLAEGLNHQVLQYKRVEQTQTAIMAAISGGTPLILGVAVYQSFESLAAARTGNIPVPAAGEQLLGGHAILAGGYDEEGVMFANWWGQNWGKNGYGKLPWAYILNPKLTYDLWALLLVE